MQNMRPTVALLLASTLITHAADAPSTTLRGYSTQSSATELDWETKFKALPQPDNIRENMRRLSARPHHVGSPYDKDNAEWLARPVEVLRPRRADRNLRHVFSPPQTNARLNWLSQSSTKPSLEEPAIAIDPTSNQKSEQLPTYNAYSIDGDVTAPLVYVNYGSPDDYEELDRMGVSVKGAIVIARYGEDLARHQTQSRRRTWRSRLHYLFRPSRRRILPWR